MIVPFVIGQWVCGPRFYGRKAEIAGLSGDPHRWLWVAGLRRIGKTSLLKQLDTLAGADGGTLPLFWDLQGVGNVVELSLTFTDALFDAEELLAGRGISVEEIEDRDVFSALEKLARALRKRGDGLLLLIDEADELMSLHWGVPGVVERLWQAVAGFEPAPRVVLASSLRLCDIAAKDESLRNLLERFATPRHLGAMTGDEARALLQQSQLPAAARPRFAEAAVEAIRDHCGNHPMLLQIVAKRYHELGDLEATFLQMEADRTIQHLLAVDFDLLLPEERQILRSIAASPESATFGEKDIRRLLALGLIRQDGPRGLSIPNRFLASWLQAPPSGRG